MTIKPGQQGLPDCPRCGHPIVQRGDNPPQFCATCGWRIAQPLLPGSRALTYAKVSIFAALGSFMPWCGVILGAVAIGFGIAALHENAQHRHPTANEVAWVGIILGALTTLAWLFLCGGVR